MMEPLRKPVSNSVEAPATALDVDGLLGQIAARFATEAGKTATAEVVSGIMDGIRWEPRPDRNPPSVVIMRRGKKVKGVSNVLAVISATGKYADLYPSWEPVLADWRSKGGGGSRVKHNDLLSGSVPAES